MNGFSGRVRNFAPLAGLTWYKLGGSARWLISPSTDAALAGVLARAADRGIESRVLGGGANVLVRDDGFDGVVVRLDGPAFTATRFDGELVQAGGGVDLMRLSHECSQRGLSGLEAMAGIPGTVGGAIRMNAGGRNGEFGGVVEGVRVVDRVGRVEELTRDDLDFGYRSSGIGNRIVVLARLRLTRSDRVRTLATFRRLMAEKKRSQPLGAKSAGCVFKNPACGSAGALIDGVGLKGVARGGASVSRVHANFIVTRRGATSAHVLAVIEYVRSEVSRRCGVDLELEIDVW